MWQMTFGEAFGLALFSIVKEMRYDWIENE
jgi:hypothetical protein